MARTSTKEITIGFPEKRFLQQFIELVADELKFVDFYFNYKFDKIKIKIIGERSAVKESIGRVKTLQRLFSRSTTSDLDGNFAHNIMLLQKLVPRIVSMDSLSTVLNYKGYDTIEQGLDIITRAPLYEVQDVLINLNKIMDEITILDISTKAVKTILLTVAYMTNLSVNFIVNKGLKWDLFREYEEKILVTKSPESIIDEFLEKMESNEVRNELKESQQIDQDNLNNRLKHLDFRRL